MLSNSYTQLSELEWFKSID